MAFVGKGEQNVLPRVGSKFRNGNKKLGRLAKQALLTLEQCGHAGTKGDSTDSKVGCYFNRGQNPSPYQIFTDVSQQSLKRPHIVKQF